MEADVTLTLVPGALAHPGARFTFRGANAGEECKGCPFQKLCFGLEPGRTYAVTGLRGVAHPCGLHDEGKAHVATVEAVDFPSSVETRLLRGTAATWSPVACGRPECASYARCHPVGPPAAQRYEITANEGELPCPAGFELTAVRLRLM